MALHSRARWLSVILSSWVLEPNFSFLIYLRTFAFGKNRLYLTEILKISDTHFNLSSNKMMTSLIDISQDIANRNLKKMNKLTLSNTVSDRKMNIICITSKVYNRLFICLCDSVAHQAINRTIYCSNGFIPWLPVLLPKNPLCTKNMDKVQYLVPCPSSTVGDYISNLDL